MILTVDDGDVNVGVRERPGCVQSCKAGTDDKHPLAHAAALICGHKYSCNGYFIYQMRQKTMPSPNRVEGRTLSRSAGV